MFLCVNKRCMLKQWRCSCGNLDSRRVCGIIWR
nr:MAG TPA: Epidermal patterning factor protein [Caudoviricetes sp.]